MTIASGMRPRRLRVPTALADGGTGARTAQEAVAALGVPSLDADNTFTRYNTFDRVDAESLNVGVLQANTSATFPIATININSNDLTFPSAFATYSFPAASGTIALLSDITAGSGGNGVVATVDFGSSFTSYATVTVVGQTWVAAGSKITVTPKADTGTEVEVALMAFSCVVSDLVAGVGFTLNVFTDVEAKGTYTFSCVGV